MAGYIRQSSFIDGDTITAALFNNEYNQLVNAFSNTSGHKHDGTTAEGPVIGLIGDAGETSPNNKVLIDTTNNYIEFYVEVSSAPVQQLYIADGAIIPVTDSDIDLGTTSLRFKDTYTDTVTTTGNVSIGGDLTVTGSATISGNLTFGDADTDSINLAAEIDSHIVPNTDDTYDLGTSTKEWRNLYIDGTANIDSLIADTADINGGTIDGATIATSDITVGSGKTLNVSAGTLTLADNQISGDKVEGGTINATTINTLTYGSLSDGTITITAFADEDDMSSNSATLVPTQQSVKAYVDSQVTAQDLDFQGDSGGALSIDLDSESLTIAGGTGLDTVGSGNTVTVNIDATVATLTGSQTLTNKTIDVDNNTVSNIEVDNLKSGVLDTDLTSVAATDTTIASAKAIKTYVDAQVTAQDLDFAGDTGGALSIDLDSESLTIAGGTGIDTTGASNTLTVAIDSTVATLTGSQTLTNKTLTSPVINTGVSGTAFLDDDTFATATASTLASSESIKAYVDTEVGAIVTDVVSDTTPQLGGDLDLNSSDITGTGNINITGTIQSSGNITGTLATAAQPNITSVGTLTGLTTTGDINFGDNDKAVFGAGSDLQIYHDGSFSYVRETGTGDLRIAGASNVQVWNSDIDSQMANFANGGAATLYYAGAAKIATTSTGVDVTGTITSDGLTVTGGDIRLYNNSTDTLIFGSALYQTIAGSSGSNDLNYRTFANHIFKTGTGSSSKTDGTERMRLNSTGLGIGTSSPNTNLHVYDASGGATLKIESNTANAYDSSKIQLLGGNLSTSEILLGDASSATTGRIIYRHDGNSLAFDVNGSEAARFDSSGNFGIGTTSPSQALHVAGSGSTILNDSTSWSYLRLKSPNTNGGYIQFADADDDDVGQIFYYHGSGGDYMSFTTNAAERMRINSSGNVGIGLTNPSEKLEVSGKIKLGGMRLASNDSGRIGLNRNPDDGSATDAALQRFQINGPATGSDFLDFQSYNSSGTYTGSFVLNGGNVGIGTTLGDVFGRGYAKSLSIDSTGITKLQIDSASGQYAGIDFGVNGTRTADINSSASSLGLNTIGAIPMTFVTNGTERMRITSNGNVGIGESSPSKPLDIKTSSGAKATIGLLQTGYESWEFGMPAGNTAFTFANSGTERMRILSTGEVHITSAGEAITPTIKHGGATGDVAKLRLINRSGQGADKGGLLELGAVTDDGVSRSDVFASIAGLKDNGTSGNKAGYMQFMTSNGSSLAEKMRLDSNGKLGLGTTDTSNAKLVIAAGTNSGDLPVLDFDGYGNYGSGASQSINFRLGRTGQATDQPAQIKGFFEGGGATAAATHIGFVFTTISANTQVDQFKIDAAYQRFKFNTTESPQSNNPQTNNCIVIGPSTSTAVSSGLTNATVLINRGGELYAVDSSHNNTQLTPHNWTLISDGPSEELAWTYWSQRPNPDNPDQLQGINVDMAKVVRKVEDLVGEKLIYTENSNMDDHTHQNIIADIQSTLADLTTRIEALEG